MHTHTRTNAHKHTLPPFPPSLWRARMYMYLPHSTLLARVTCETRGTHAGAVSRCTKSRQPTHGDGRAVRCAQGDSEPGIRGPSGCVIKSLLLVPKSENQCGTTYIYDSQPRPIVVLVPIHMRGFTAGLFKMSIYCLYASHCFLIKVQMNLFVFDSMKSNCFSCFSCWL